MAPRGRQSKSESGNEADEIALLPAPLIACHVSLTRPYLDIDSTYSDIYGGLCLFFRISSSHYLQLVVPLNFSGTGGVRSLSYNYALVGGSNYAYVASGQVTRLPETATWLMMLAGFGAIGVTLRLRAHLWIETVSSM